MSLTSVGKGKLYEAQVVEELEIWGINTLSPSGGVRAAIRFPTSSPLSPSCRFQCYVGSTQKAGNSISAKVLQYRASSVTMPAHRGSGVKKAHDQQDGGIMQSISRFMQVKVVIYPYTVAG